MGTHINPTARKKLGDALIEGDLRLVSEEAVRQVQAGAHILDVNVGYPGVDEPRMIREVIKAVVGAIDVPICLDSANPEVMEAGLADYEGKMLLSSVTGEADKMERILSLVKRYGTAVVAMCMDENGIPNHAWREGRHSREDSPASRSAGHPTGRRHRGLRLHGRLHRYQRRPGHPASGKTAQRAAGV